MNKFEVINEIIRLYDCIESNEKEKEIALIKKENMKHDETIDCLKNKIYNVGVDKLIDDCVFSWKKPYVNSDGILETYEDWLSEVIYGLPDWISRKDFIGLFNDKLMDIYKDRCKITLKEWKEAHENHD